MRKHCWTLLIIGLAQVCRAIECGNSASLPEYVDCKTQALVARQIATTDPSKQSEPLALAPNSTTLVDKTSGPDVVGTTIGIPGLSSKSGLPSSTDLSVAISMYGVYAAAVRSNPFDSATYASKTWWRRLSFTLADSFPADNTAAASQGSYTFGTKYLLSGSRDVADPSNAQKLSQLVPAMERSTVAYSSMYAAVQQYFYERFGAGSPRADFIAGTRSPGRFGAMIAALMGRDIRLIEAILERGIQSQVDLKKDTMSVVRGIRNRPQLSVVFSSRISKGTSPNLYRSGVAFDIGLGAISSSSNATYDFVNAQTSGSTNKQIARLAEELQWPIPVRTWTAAKLRLVGSGEGDWGSSTAPAYKAQAKLVIPLSPGIDVPISFIYVSSVSNGKSDSKVQAAFTLDVAKLALAVPRQPSP